MRSEEIIRKIVFKTTGLRNTRLCCKVKDVINALVSPEESKLQREDILLQKTEGDKAALAVENRTLRSYRVEDEDVLQVVSNSTAAGFFT